MNKIKNKIKEYINWQTLLILFVNVFLAHYAILGIALFGIFLIYGYFGDESLKRDIIICTALIFFFIFSVLRLFCLPILYSKLEKKIIKSGCTKAYFTFENQQSFPL